MKTRAQIETRIAELKLLLAKETEFIRSTGGGAGKMYRLQGNIGALEWVLREGN